MSYGNKIRIVSRTRDSVQVESTRRDGLGKRLTQLSRVPGTNYWAITGVSAYWSSLAEAMKWERDRSYIPMNNEAV